MREEPALRVARLERELDQARRVIEVLKDRAESALMKSQPGDAALVNTILGLESAVRQEKTVRADTEADYRKLFDAHPDGLLLLDGGLRVRAGNAEACMIFLREHEQLVGTHLSEYLSPDAHARVQTWLAAGRSGSSLARLELVDGRVRNVSVTRLEDGRPLLAFRRVSEVRRLTEELARSRRQAALGRLAADMIRAMADPLGLIMARLDLLLGSEESGGPDQSHLLSMRRGAERLSDITRDLAELASPQAPKWENLRVYPVLRGAVDEALRRSPRGRIALGNAGRRTRIQTDRTKLHNLVVQLLVHACATSPPGRTVEVDLITDDQGDVAIRVTRPGRGLSRSERQGRSPLEGEGADSAPGLGLGLGLAWMVTVELGGTLTATDRTTDGAVYRVGLPGQRESPGAAALGARRRLLVVDDDPLLAQTLETMLEIEGYDIASASSAEDALVTLEKRRFDLLLTDIVLPGMDGEALARKALDRWAAGGLQVLLTSGRLTPPETKLPFLQKPFDRVQLLGAIHDLLGEG